MILVFQITKLYFTKKRNKKNQKSIRPRPAKRALSKQTKHLLSEMATVTIPVADLLEQFRARADLEAQVAVLTAKLAALDSVSTKTKSNGPSKSKFSTEEERKEAYKQRAIKAAASRKAKKEAVKPVVEDQTVVEDDVDTKWVAEMRALKESQAAKWVASTTLGEESEAESEESDYSKHSSQQETDNDDN